MKTIVLDEPGSFRLTQTGEPSAPGADEALVRVRQIGICGTDLHAFRGQQPFFSYPRILGHELGVVVEAIGSDVTNVTVGDRCAVEPYLNCGVCIACRRGRTNCCTDLQVLGVHMDGGMREFITVPAHKLHPSSTLPLAHLATVEMLCIGAHAVRRAQIATGEKVLLIGLGPIGLGVAQFAQIAGADVIVQEMAEERMAFGREQLGIQHFVDAKRDVAPQLETILDGDLPTIVFDATGNVNSMNAAFNSVAHSGKLVFVGLVQGDITFHDPYLHSYDMTILASRNAAAEDFAFVIDRLEAGAVNIEPWITHHSAYDSLIDDFPFWLDPKNGVIKAMLEL